MNEEGFWKGELRENRLTIIIMSAISAVLAVVLVVLIIVRNNTDAVEEETSAVVEREEAVESGLDVEPYLDELRAVLVGNYGEKMDGYEMGRGKLLLDGDWYVTTITQSLEDQWSLPGDTYRVVMRKVGGQWQVVAGPSLVFSYVEYPDIPEGVILSANNL